MIEELPELVNQNPALVRRGRWTNAVMLLGLGEQYWLVTIAEGRITECRRQSLRISAFDFAITGDEQAWRKFWAQTPPPMHHDLHALLRIEAIRIEGDIDLLLANMLYFKIMLETLRGRVR